MKFTWKFDYVPEGQMTPDEHNRWGVICYIEVPVKSVPYFKKLYKDFMEVAHIPIAFIHQKECLPEGGVPSNVHKFACEIPTFWEAANFGYGNKNLFSNDLEELKKMVEEEYLITQQVFTNCL